jgi:quercetin dioxygenase-like cupin family protein
VSRRRSADDSELLSRVLQEKLATAIKPAELGTAQREQLRRRVLERAHDRAPEGTTTLRAEKSPWVEIAPFIQVRELHRDKAAGTHTSLMKMLPGGMIPAHRHEKQEEFIVLEGECQIGSHQLRAGDAHIAGPGSWHDAVTTVTGVLVLLRGEYPHPAPAQAAPG